MELVIVMDNATYSFTDKEYTEYDVLDDCILIYNKDKVIGLFNRAHFVSLIEREA